MELNKPSIMLTNLLKDSFLHLEQLLELFSSQTDKEMLLVLFFIYIFFTQRFHCNFCNSLLLWNSKLKWKYWKFCWWKVRHDCISCHDSLVVTLTINTCQIVNGLSTELQAKELSLISLNLTWNRTMTMLQVLMNFPWIFLHQVYDGPDTSSHLLASFTGIVRPNSVVGSIGMFSFIE